MQSLNGVILFGRLSDIHSEESSEIVNLNVSYLRYNSFQSLK